MRRAGPRAGRDRDAEIPGEKMAPAWRPRRRVAGSANARIYIGFDKHARAVEEPARAGAD